ncbi:MULTISPECIES: hypothetical protein [Vibrio]|uniref:hypothetical protein n=1 Tax=Vibrio TaxID=662 RepID=UPI00080370F8|nr:MULTISPECIES: hypothetical protein [Vibrio]MDF5003973.1 hypothetical protein [Vibrio parahaemolyticus]ANP63864.1 hypothetical protein BAU10_02210 [Vibrio alginolyticus]MBS9934497.1 hypothetical protein [Vibrio alginolyticus]MDW1926210.1 hypothetical protein [Vibrio sp. 947]MDW1976483.1 hypothetical protein [Vibrio sp. Vb1980]
MTNTALKLNALINHEYSVSLTIEELARQTCMPATEIEAAIKVLEDRNLVTVVKLPLSEPRYIIDIKGIKNQGMRNG